MANDRNDDRNRMNDEVRGTDRIPEREDMNGERARGGDDEVRGIASDDSDDDFEDADDLDQDEEDEAI